LTIHKVPIRSIMKLQRLQNTVLRFTDKFPWSTPIHDMHMTFQIQYVCDYITKLCRQQSQVIQNHGNAHVCNIGEGEARHRKYKKLKLDGAQVYGHSSSVATWTTLDIELSAIPTMDSKRSRICIGNLALQAGGFSNLRGLKHGHGKDMVTSPTGLGPEKGGAGKAQKQLQNTQPTSRQRGRPTSRNLQMSEDD
jgi:hypothetical protein